MGLSVALTPDLAWLTPSQPVAMSLSSLPESAVSSPTMSAVSSLTESAVSSPTMSAVSSPMLSALFVAELTLLAALAVAIWSTARTVRSGRGPEGAGSILPVGLALWALGHVVEAATVAFHPRPFAFGPSDIAFVVVSAGLGAASLRVLRRSATYGDWTATLRTGLDAALIALAVVVGYWQWVVMRFAGQGPSVAAGSWTACVMATTYTALCSLLAAAMITRAWQRREMGSWLLAAGTLSCVLGVALWSTAKFGPDLRFAGVAMMILGVLLVPVAVAHPGHQAPVVVRAGDERDQLGALAAHLAVWALTYVGLRGQLISTVLVVLAVVCVVTIFARVFLVRRSERHLVARLRRMAFTDPLTGIGNRRSLAAALADVGPAWLITLDLDGFKQVNDEHGHEAGDTVLCTVARRLIELSPPQAHLARIGGDEFAVALPGSGALAEEYAERLVAQARDPRYPAVTLSVGLAEVGDDPTTSLRDADIALREAKRTGKNRVARLTPALLGRQLREVEVAARLRSGMAEVQLAYQPVVALSPRGGPHAVVAVEGLARWHDDLLGDVSPAEFVPICERHGLIGELGLHVLSVGLRQLASWHAAGLPHQLTVNVSWQQLRDPQIVAGMAALLSSHPTLTRWLVLEVTESVFADDPQAGAAVARLREHGVGIAVDDFGAGASTLTRLRDLPADILKIDRSLLDGAGVDPAADSILALVHGLGDSLGLAVIAEGIEDADTARLLGELGFRYAQGHHFGAPGPASVLPVPLGQRLGRRARRPRYAGA